MATNHFTTSFIGIVCVLIFVTAYLFVVLEEFLHLRKSKPVVIAAGLIWALVGIAYTAAGQPQTAGEAVRHNILEFGELMLFLLVAMTFINTMEERQVFAALRAWLISSGYSLRTIYWLTGLLAFFISPVADNLTTALLMAAVVLAVGAGNAAFITVGCINIVVAANAGGAFSPFGDITTLMVWQKGIVPFQDFFALLVPSAVNWLIPAAIMSTVVPKTLPDTQQQHVSVKPGGFVVIALFGLTIAMAVSAHQFLHLPPVLGMTTGLGLLQLLGYFLKRRGHNHDIGHPEPDASQPATDDRTDPLPELQHAGRSVGAASTVADTATPSVPFDIFEQIRRAEWDTLLFFYGVILCVGGLGTLGYLAMISEGFYVGLGPTAANTLIGVLSAIVDNIPVMFAVLTMAPDMPLEQWLLVTLTAGVGGSLLSIGSAAGVALMGQARGIYTFFAHLRWSWAIALGYFASILTHLALS